MRSSESPVPVARGLWSRLLDLVVASPSRPRLTQLRPRRRNCRDEAAGQTCVSRFERRPHPLAGHPLAGGELLQRPREVGLGGGELMHRCLLTPRILAASKPETQIA